ncbi:uncharacterized protein LOC144065507 isoform X2 [Stigmatopora argus]
MSTGTKRQKFQEELFDLKGYRLEGFRNDLGADGQESVDLEGEVELPQIKEEEPEFPQQQIGDEQLPIKREEDHFTWSLGEFVKREDVLGVASGGVEPANTTTSSLIKEEEPEFPQLQMGDEQLPIKKEEDYFTWSPDFRENLSPDGQEFVGLKELPQIKEEEPELPQQQMREEQLPIQKEEDDDTWSPGEALTRQDDLGRASGGAEPANASSWPQIKEEEPEFSQQTMIDEQLPIKNEEDYVTWSPGESLTRQDDLGVANVGVEPENASTWLQNIEEEEPEFPQQCKKEQPSIKNEECVKWSTGEPFKSEDDLGVANRRAELLSGSSTEGWRAENLIAPLSDGNDSLFAHDDVEDVKKNPSGDKLCKCFQCGKTSGKKSNLKRHMRSHTGEKPLSCTVCGKTFTHKGKFKMHTRTHTGEKTFSCSICGQAFSQQQHLKRHTRTHRGEKPFSCSVCGHRFTRKESLISHARTHTGEKPFSCSICGQGFTDKGNLKSHIRTHTDKKTFSCSVCGQTFTQRGHLKNHTRTHTGEKPFSCSVCGQRFTRKDSLICHARSHTGEKPFSCSVCGQTFTRKEKLKIHTRTHTGEEPFSCSVCGRRFTYKESLKYHIKTHTAQKTFSCSVCGQTFTQKGNLKTHTRTHTGEKPFSCSVCGQTFSQRRSLKEHLSTHTGEQCFPAQSVATDSLQQPN